VDNRKQDNITLKELIGGILSAFRYLFSKWKVLIAALILGALAGLLYSAVSDEEYTAEVTFVLEGDNPSGSLEMYAGLARQFGLDFGSGAAGSAFSAENFTALLKSRLLIEKALLAPIDSHPNGKVCIADYYIETHGMWNDLGIDKNTQAFSRPPVYRDSLSRKQNAILRRLYNEILDEHLLIEQDKSSSFVNVSVISKDELFSKLFVEHLMEEAADFYVQTKTKRARESIEKLEQKADSIEKVLNEQTYALASSQDLNRNPARQVATVGIEFAAREKQILQSIYSEVMKNLEISKIALLKDTPLIQVIDSPVLPLKKHTAKAIVWIPLAAFLAAFITAIFLLMEFVYKNIMQS